MADERIKIATTNPSLLKKIQTKIDVSSNVIYWHMKFNIPLDPISVSEKNMDVTDTDGYIMRTDIAYDDEKNTIVISPLDTYEQNRYYLLNVSKKVKSKRGQYLKSPIHVLFKLIGTQISEYQVLKKHINVPKPKRRPKDYNEVYTRSKVYSMDGKIMENVKQNKLPPADFDINVFVGVGGLIISVAGMLASQLVVAMAGFVACILGVLHIIYQLSRPRLRSIITYNKGARLFNKERYLVAEICFKRAVDLDENNELAEYALNKVGFYL